MQSDVGVRATAIDKMGRSLKSVVEVQAREGKVRAAALRKLMENEELRARMPTGTVVE